MAYDLIVVDGSKVKDSPVIVGSIDYEEISALGYLVVT
jgi:hypothetical protein